MARRRWQRSSAEDAPIGGIIVLALLVGSSSWQWLRSFPGPVAIVLFTVIATGLILLVWGLICLVQRRQRQRLVLADALALSPGDFERRVQLLLRDLGWEQVRLVGGSSDGGVDLRAVCDGQRSIIQCKRYKGLVGPEKVRDLYGALQHEGADQALLVTTGFFGRATHDWVRDKPIMLWDGEQFAQYVREATEAQQTPEARARRARGVYRFLGGLAVVNMVVMVVSAML